MARTSKTTTFVCQEGSEIQSLRDVADSSQVVLPACFCSLCFPAAKGKGRRAKGQFGEGAKPPLGSYLSS